MMMQRTKEVCEARDNLFVLNSFLFFQASSGSERSDRFALRRPIAPRQYRREQERRGQIKTTAHCTDAPSAAMQLYLANYGNYGNDTKLWK